MIRLIIVLTLVLNLAACSSKPNHPSTKSAPNESTFTQSAKEEEYKRKIAALDKKVKELEKQKTKPVEAAPPKEVSAPKEESVPQEVSASKKAEEPKELSQRLQTKPIHHIVKKGEWLSTIAKQYQTTTEKLL